MLQRPEAATFLFGVFWPCGDGGVHSRLRCQVLVDFVSWLGSFAPGAGASCGLPGVVRRSRFMATLGGLEARGFCLPWFYFRKMLRCLFFRVCVRSRHHSGVWCIVVVCVSFALEGSSFRCVFEWTVRRCVTGMA